MLNLKKGLALVLAAATALTFAPVSTLGLTGVVQAQAAGTIVNATKVSIKNKTSQQSTDAYLIGTVSLKLNHKYELYSAKVLPEPAVAMTKDSTATFYVVPVNDTDKQAVIDSTTGDITPTSSDIDESKEYNIYVNASEAQGEITQDNTSYKFEVVDLGDTTKTKSAISATATGATASDGDAVVADAANVVTGWHKVTGLKNGHVYAINGGVNAGSYNASANTHAAYTATSYAHVQDVDEELTVKDGASYKIKDLGAYTELATNYADAKKIGASVTLSSDIPSTVDPANRSDLIETSIKIPKQAYGDSDYANSTNNTLTGSENATDQIAGVDRVIRLDDGSGFYLKGAKIKIENGHSYDLFSSDGLYFYNTSKTVTRSTVFTDTVKSAGQIKENDPIPSSAYTRFNAAGTNNDYITVDIFVPASKTYNITLSDTTNAGEKVSTAAINIKLDASINDQKFEDPLDIVKLDQIREDFDVNGVHSAWHNGFVNGGSTSYNDGEVYQLALNGTKYGYALTGLGTGKSVYTWTGVEKHNVTVSIDGTHGDYLESSGTLVEQHVYVDDTNGAVKTIASPKTADDRARLYANSATTDSDAQTPDKFTVFKPQTVSTTADQVSLTVKASYDNTAFITKLPITVDKSSKAIDYVTYQGKYDSDTYVSEESAQGIRYDNLNNEIGRTYTYDDKKIKANNDKNTDFTIENLDKQVNNTATIKVKSEGAYTLQSSDPSIVTVDADGKLTAVSVGRADIIVFVTSTSNNFAKVATIHVNVADFATDHITASFSGNTDYRSDHANLDKASQSAAGAVKTDTVSVKSEGGLNWVVEGGDNSHFTAVKSADGNSVVVTAKDSAGVGTFTVRTLNSLDNKIKGSTKEFTVNVWNDPAANFSVSDVTVDINSSTSLQDYITVSSPASYQVAWAAASNQQYYTLTNDPVAKSNQTSSRLTSGNSVGSTVVFATVTGKGIHPTTHKATVTVKNDSLVPTIKVNKNLVVLDVDGTDQLTAEASNKATVSFALTDGTGVVDVTSGGAIKALKAGTATITATANGAAPATISVVVNEKAPVVVDPVAVTGLKVKNKKGAYVSVTWDAQDPSILYRVYKKVGNASWKAKNVTDPKATLQVKKGAKVQVKVKAFRRDENGKAVWGPKATKAKTFKTDKK